MAQADSERLHSSISVYILAENRLLREALVRLFQNRAGISVFGESRYSDSATEQIAASHCDVLLLDSTAATLATTLIGELNESAAEIKIILFGMDEDPDSFLKAVRCGVCGYLLREASSAEIIAAVRGVAQGEAICSPRLCMSLFQFVSRASRQRPEMADQRAYIKLGLTYRQRQLMTLVARGLTNKEIAANLNLSEFTVKNHIHRIMKQIHAENRQEAVDVVRAGRFLANA
jgi:DNA-binding NarL/FixJ family response regulator